MRDQMLKLVIIGLATTWLLTLPPALSAQTDNCFCYGRYDGWLYVLVNPNCGTGYYNTSTYAVSAGTCTQYCQFAVGQQATLACSFICDPPEWGNHPASYTYGYCYDYTSAPSEWGCSGAYAYSGQC